jgi:hypothetical protein
MPQGGATSGTASGTVINHILRVGHLFQRLALMALLAAGILPRGFPEASYPWRLLQSIARGWFGTVGAVQSQAAFKFLDLAPQGHVLGSNGLHLDPLGLHLRRLCVKARRQNIYMGRLGGDDGKELIISRPIL